MDSPFKNMNNVTEEIVEAIAKPCPFCGNIPNIFQVPESRYGELATRGWFIQCKNMGCYCYKEEAPNTGDQSFSHALEEWNTRIKL